MDTAMVESIIPHQIDKEIMIPMTQSPGGVAMIECDCVVDDDSMPAEQGIVTPRPSSEQAILHAVTPEPDSPSPSSSPSSELLLTRELEEARLDAQQSSDALDNLVEGIRMVKRILERDPSVEDARSTRDRIEELKALNSISEKLHGVLGSDLLGLLNAADMVREHAKLSVLEASALVNDVADARKDAEESQHCARQLKKISRALYKENKSLREEVKQLRTERKALVMEVKVLREEAEVTKQYDTWRLLEHHVLDSIEIHERVLKTPTTPKRSNQFADVDFCEEKQQEETDSVVTGNDTGSNYEVVVASSSVESESSEPEHENEAPVASKPNNEIEQNHEPAPPKEVSSCTDEQNETKANPGKPQMVAPSPARIVSQSAFSGLRSFFTPRDIRDESKAQPPSPPTTEEKSASVPAKDASSASDDNRQKDEKDDTSEEKKNEPAAPQSTNIDGSTMSNRTKSPVPGLEEASGCCTDDSSQFTRTSKSAHQEGCPKTFPTEFSFQIPDRVVTPTLASPLLSPNGSPAGVGTIQPKPICNEKILRTLAIPSGEDDVGGHVLYARTTLEAGLYEC